MTTRRSFLKFLGLSPAASLVPAETQAKLIAAAEAVAAENEDDELELVEDGNYPAECNLTCTIGFIEPRFVRIQCIK